MKKNSGQTLVEVMVALFVLVTGFLGILSLLAQSLYISKNITNETTATYLASEGIELARNIVDHDMYQTIAQNGGTGWVQGGSDTAFDTACNYYQATPCEYQLDYATCNDLGSNPAVACIPTIYQGNPLLFDSTTGLYGYETGIASPFTRVIIVSSDLSSPNEITVQSIVTWRVGLGINNVTLEDHFYNWIPQS